MVEFKTVIIAAGLGKRMKSDKPKAVQKILGKSLIQFVVEAAVEAGSRKIAVVVGTGAELVKAELEEYADLEYYLQKEQLGTGHAVAAAGMFVSDTDDVVILQGDSPLTHPETIRELVSMHRNGGYSLSLISVDVENPTGYGRIKRGLNGQFIKIAEDADLSDEEKKCPAEINAGVYCVGGKALKEALALLENSNAQKEYYFTDVPGILADKGLGIGVLKAEDTDGFIGINTMEQLAQAARVVQKRVNFKHMQNGVNIPDPCSVYISPGVVIGSGSSLYPGTIIEGRSFIGEKCSVGPNAVITDTDIKDGVSFVMSAAKESVVGSGSSVGPFAYLRPGSVVGENVKIGDFVEIKNSVIGDDTKISHLAYVGDADVGKNVNFGCGCVTVNYDGSNKHKTIIEDNAFIGCNTNLIAPVTVGYGGYTAAGSTITGDVPENSLSVARARQKDIRDWALKRREKRE